MTTGTSIVQVWQERVRRHPDGVALRYFDHAMTAAELDRASDAAAAAFASLGTRRGDHVGIYLQNIPQFAVSLLALWKLGAAALILNPMYRKTELRRLIDDSGAAGIVCSDVDAAETQQTLEGSSVRWIVSTSAREYQTRDDPRVFPDVRCDDIAPDGDLLELISRFDGHRATVEGIEPDTIALLVYTSGTTGPPKGAMCSHANVLSVTSTYGSWVGLEAGDVVLAMAPLFHITGAVVNAAVALLHDTTLVFANRFHPEVALEAFAEHGVTTTIGSITAYSAMSAVPWADRHHFASVKALYSGGAPIPPATVERFEERFGVYIHNGYGMTETTSAVIAVPPGERAPVHQASGTLSVGKPLTDVSVRVIDPTGAPLPSGVEGELEIAGPQVVPAYLNQPEATASTMPGGRLRTGDGAIVDDDGWVYLVDRLKDQINTSGYKVWPREVEDVLYEHPAVYEAAVVGQPDDYRGERVVAYVSLRAGTTVTSEELIELARERLAPYKSPREVHVLDDLPKTQTGKIRRRELRDRPAQ
ncbi:class I adenylate-forming enzyme family protein [Aeromicrobium wangtongii]|uniref:class I adenylate-forming enzyme family protein n=1 Tax=Aeromicrobium wangtongii TaxID=2969247 RepID=UPI002017B3CD|nr:AMP-binding protein [Aeromicrobium wangtongii]MCL3816963.1 AMP-binding protein [Aeromicrobium wangtongii]